MTGRAATSTSSQAAGRPGSQRCYHLDEQVGFILRRANQRHIGIFSKLIPQVTPTQFAVLAKLHEIGPISQNALGQATAMDAATIKGVVNRLEIRGLARTGRDPSDRRRIVVSLSESGCTLVEELFAKAAEITRETLAPLTARDQATLLRLLARLT